MPNSKMNPKKKQKKKVNSKESTPQQSIPQQSIPQQSTPQQSTPQQSTPQQSTPQQSTPLTPQQQNVIFVKNTENATQSFISKYKYYIIVIIILIFIAIGITIWLVIKNNTKKGSSYISNNNNNNATTSIPLRKNATTRTTKYVPYNILSICGSNDSKFIYALSNNSVLNISRDNGLSWTSKILDLEVIVDNIITNFDGSILLVYKTNSNFYAYSKDSADTWTSNNIPKGDYYPLNIKMMSMNYDMSILFLIDSKQTSSTTPAPINGIYSSTGTSGYIYFKYPDISFWTQRGSLKEYVSIDCNNSGSVIVSCIYNEMPIILLKKPFTDNTITTPTVVDRLDDYVVFFTNFSNNKRNWTCVSTTESGSKIAFGSLNSYITVGQTENQDLSITSDWSFTDTTSVLGKRNWSCVKYSGNGSFLIAAEKEGYIYQSNNDGESWLQLDFAYDNWKELFIDNFGHIIAINTNGKIYIKI